MDSLIYKDGQILRPEQATVSVMDRGFLFGDGVYEAGRSYQGCYLFLEEHWERFRHSADKLLLEIPWSDRELTEGLHRVSEAFGQDCCFRTIVTRGRIDKVGLDLDPVTPPTLIHVVQEVPASYATQRKEGVVLDTSVIARNPAGAQDPNIKTSNYLNSLLAQQDVKRRTGRVNAILCNAEGEVTEGTNFSVFGVKKDGTVITPSLGIGILESITRRHVLAHARKIGKIEEGRYRVEEFHDCAETFIVSSTREVMPVREWDHVRFPAPGPITAKLGQLLSLEIEQYVATHPKFKLT